MNLTSIKNKRGTAALEFALGWSVLWMLFAGVYQVGYAYYIYNVLLTSVSNAAQLGSRLGYDNGSPSAYTNALKNMVVYGDEVTGTKPLVPNLSTGQVAVDVITSGPANVPQYVTVYISGYTINALFANFSLTSKPRATTAYFGKFTCSVGSNC